MASTCIVGMKPGCLILHGTWKYLSGIFFFHYYHYRHLLASNQYRIKNQCNIDNISVAFNVSVLCFCLCTFPILFKLIISSYFYFLFIFTSSSSTKLIYISSKCFIENEEVDIVTGERNFNVYSFPGFSFKVFL